MSVGVLGNPALRVLEWRYRDQLDWRLVLVGLSEDTSAAAASGVTLARRAAGRLAFRDRYGMPFSATPKERLYPSSPACRAVIAARLQAPGSEWRVFRAIQFANFTSPLLFDDAGMMREVLREIPGIDADHVIGAIDSPEVLEEYARDKGETRTAEGSATELQGKARNSDGLVRYTAPSLVLDAPDGRRLEAGGFQPVEAYDVLVANLDPTLVRHPPPDDPEPVLRYFEFGLCTQEVAALLARGNDAPDRAAAEVRLVDLVGDGRAVRHPLADDALWTAADRS